MKEINLMLKDVLFKIAARTKHDKNCAYVTTSIQLNPGADIIQHACNCGLEKLMGEIANIEIEV